MKGGSDEDEESEGPFGQCKDMYVTISGAKLADLAEFLLLTTFLALSPLFQSHLPLFNFGVATHVILG